MKKISVFFLLLFFVFNTAFAFDPYADEEPETKSRAKLYYGIAMTLIGGFLAYDGFSQEKIDISRPSVDYGSAISANYVSGEQADYYTIRAGKPLPWRERYDHTNLFYPGQTYDEWLEYSDTNKYQKNFIYNTGNVDLTDVKVLVRYRYNNNDIISPIYVQEGGNIIIVRDRDVISYREINPSNSDLKKGESASWTDEVLTETTRGDVENNPPNGDNNKDRYEEDALDLIDVTVSYKYKKIYKKQNKSDIEGVVGLMFATAGIYFIIDYFLDLREFNQYVRKHDMNFRFVHANNDEYKLLLQKRI